jgi:hypothetical protein
MAPENLSDVKNLCITTRSNNASKGTKNNIWKDWKIEIWIIAFILNDIKYVIYASSTLKHDHYNGFIEYCNKNILSYQEIQQCYNDKDDEYQDEDGETVDEDFLNVDTQYPHGIVYHVYL